jgi:hypothetical protein
MTAAVIAAATAAVATAAASPVERIGVSKRMRRRGGEIL